MLNAMSSDSKSSTNRFPLGFARFSGIFMDFYQISPPKNFGKQ
jgi:hypothetical protein